MTPLYRAAALFLFVSPPAFAQGPAQNLDALERKLVITLGADIGQPGGPRAAIDRRLMLANCPEDVAIDAPVMGAVALRCASIGWRIRVPLLAGGSAAARQSAAMTTAPAIKAIPVVRRGDPIELAAGKAGFIVTSEVIAEQDGAPGDRIRVRAEGKTPMMVEVIESGRARLPGFN